MAGVQVLRIESRPTLDVGLVRHIVGESRPETARDVDQRVVDLGGVGLEAGRAAILAAAPKGRGRRPNHAVEFLLAGAPPYGPDEWSEEREREFAQACYDWAREVLGPRSVIVSAAWHRDETSPHVHVLAIPIDSAGKLRWKGVRDEAANRLGSPRSARGGQYRVLQDDFHAAVASRYDLGRGEIGSQATHHEIDRARAAERRREEAERAAAAAEAATVETRALLGKRNDLHEEAVELLGRRLDAQAETVRAERELEGVTRKLDQARAVEAWVEARVQADGGLVRRLKRQVQARSRLRDRHREVRQVRGDAERRSEKVGAREHAVLVREVDADEIGGNLERRAAELREEAQAVQGREEDLRADQAALAGAQAAVAGGQAAIRTQGVELGDREAKAQVILGREGALVDGERKLGVEQTTVGERVAGVEEREAAVQVRGEDLAKAEAALERGQRKLGVEQTAVGERVAGVAEREAAVQVRGDDLAKAEAVLERGQRKLGVEQTAVGERVAGLDERETAVQGREEDLRAGQAALAGAQAAVAGGQAAIRTQAVELGDREAKAQAILGREGTLVDGERQLAAAEATAQTRTEELEDREAKAQAILDREAALEDGERRFEPRSAALKKREQEIEKESSRLDEGVHGLGAEREAHNSAKKALEREQEALQGDQEALKRDQTTAQAIVAREEALKDDERRLEEKRTDVENEEAAVKARSAKLEKREEEANDRDREQDENAENLNDYYDWLVKRSTSLDEHQAHLKESFDELTTATPRVNRILATAEARTKLLLADAEIRWTAAGGGEELGRAAAKWVKGKYGSDAENALLRELGRVNPVLAEPIFTLPPDDDPFARVDLKLPAKPPAKLPAVPEPKARQRRAPDRGIGR